MYHNDALLLSGLDTASAIDTTYVVSDDVVKIDAVVVDKYCSVVMPRQMDAGELLACVHCNGNAEKYETGMMQEF
jgi:hypothetical protein